MLVAVRCDLLVIENYRAQPAQFAAVLFAKAMENGSHFGVERRLDGIEQLDAFGGNEGDGLLFIFAAAKPPDQPAGLQAIEEARDVRGAIEHAAGDLAARVSLRVDTAQDAQHVVLRAGDFA